MYVTTYPSSATHTHGARVPVDCTSHSSHCSCRTMGNAFIPKRRTKRGSRVLTRGLHPCRIETPLHGMGPAGAGLYQLVFEAQIAPWNLYIG